jgi:hypothetical protein
MRVLPSILVALLALTSTAEGQRSRQITGRCGFTLAIPRSWSIKSAEPWQVQDSCAVELGTTRHAKFVRMLTLELFSGREHDMCDKVMICRDDSGIWQISGRAGTTNRAEVLETPQWRELIGVSETGWYGDDGNSGYQGMAQVYVALLDDRNGRMAIFVASHDLGDEDAFKSVVASFRFRPRPPN